MGGLLLHLFLPHHTNNHRPKVLHVDALFVYVLILAIFNLGIRLVYRQYPQVLGYATDIQIEQLLSGTNAKRQEAGLASLQLNSELSAAAAGKAQDMFAQSYWAHVSPSGKTPWDFIISSGYRYTVAGENLAKNFSTSQAVVDAWMASPTHRDNIFKSNYRDIGFAVVNGVLNGEETTLVVQMFGAGTSQLAVVPRTTTAVGSEAETTVKQQPTPVLTPVPAAAGSQKPVVESEAASVAAQIKPGQWLAAQLPIGFMGVSKNPRFNIPSVTRDVVFVFVGLLMGILVLDTWVTARRHIVRVVGHNLAHLLFLAALLIATGALQRGSLL